MKNLLLITSLLVASAPPAAAQEGNQDASSLVWSARDVPGETVDTIINRNIFVPGQRRAPRFETSTESEPDDQPPTIEAEPEDPDRRFRLIGSSFSTGQWIAFIEQADTADIHRVATDEAIGAGKVTGIDFDRIEYEANGETRSILMGRDLTGAEPVARTPSYTTSNGASSTATTASSTDGAAPPTGDGQSDAEARRAEILRQLRERRERENQ